jgi:membrane-bound lytic murein transglycosylase D
VVGLSLVSALGALCLSTAASASLVVIGSKDININQLNDTQLSSIFLGKSVSLPTGETLNPVDQDPNSKIYNAFYQQVASMDASSVNSYWSQITFSGTGEQPPEVEGDRSAIASVENSKKAIAYVDSGSLGAQLSNVKILYGSVSDTERNAAQDAMESQSDSAQSHHSNDSHHDASNEQLREQLSHEIAELKQQQQHYQELNDQRQRQLIDILKTEQQVQKKHPEATATISASPKQQLAVAAPTDLWAAMRDNFKLTSNGHSAAVKHELAWYLAHKWVVQMIVKNSEPYLGYVYQETQKRGMPAEFALLPMVESGYVPFATSPAGAKGLWQIMPNTASGSGLKINWWYDGRLDVVNSTNAALDDLVRLKGGLHSWPLAAAAYNYGEGGVLSAVDFNRRKGLSTDYWSLPLPQETKDYVPKLLALAEIIRNPSKYGITLPALTTEPNFQSIKLSSQIDRAQIADLADTTEEVVHELNPGMLRWATGTNGSYDLAIPTDKVATFKINLARLANQKRLLWVYHGVHNESLNDVSKNYHTTVKELMKINQLHTASVKNGQGILVPMFSNKTYAGFSAAVQGSSAKIKIAQQLSRAAVKPLPQENTVVASNTAIQQPVAQHTAPSSAVSTSGSAGNSIDNVTANSLLAGGHQQMQQQAEQPATAQPQAQQPTSTTSVQTQQSPQSTNGNNLKALMNKLYE